MQERKKNDVLQFEIDSLRKRVELSQNISHQLKAKLINIAKEIVEIYGKEIIITTIMYTMLLGNTNAPRPSNVTNLSALSKK